MAASIVCRTPFAGGLVMTTTLAGFERAKFQLAEIIREVGALRAPPPAEDPEAAELMVRLAEDRFDVAVIGRFSRGKSSLMNALLRSDRLPTGLLPLTSVLTAVTYGTDPSVRLSYEGRISTEVAPLEELPKYVTEGGNPGNRRKIKLAEILLPAELLRRGVRFVDTPGLGSAILANTQTTLDYAAEADAFILVTAFDSALSQEELDVLTQLRRDRKPVFVVVNKSDAVSPAERQAVLAFVEHRLSELFSSGPSPPVFATSALEGMRAGARNDADGLAASGVTPLEAALLGYLLGAKQADFLRIMVDRTGALLRHGSPGAGPERAAIARKLDALADEIGAPLTDACGGLGGLAPVASEQAGVCEVCLQVEAALFDDLAKRQYRLSVDAEARLALAGSGGFCPQHTWAYNAIGSPHGVTLGYPDVVEAYSRGLLAAAETPSGLAGVGRVFAPTPPDACPACLTCRSAADTAIAQAAERLRASPDAVDALSAICLAHLGELCAAVEDPILSARILKREAALLERVSEDMRRYAIKREALRRPLASRSEDMAPARALRMLAGVPNMSFIPRRS